MAGHRSCGGKGGGDGVEDCRLASQRKVRRSVPLKLAVNFVIVTRPRKYAPFLLVFLNAHLLLTGQADWSNLFYAGLFIATSCSFGMRLNAWTDRELDQSTKPELFGHLAQSFKFHFFVMVVEAAISLVSLVFLMCRQKSSDAVWLSVFGALFSLYSFNFFIPRRGKEYRLKIYWWGNLVAAGGGYFALWMAGLSSGPGNTNFETRLFLALFCASLEYAVFLGECATDAEEERMAGLRTAPAKLGRLGTVLLAWISCLLSTIIWYGFGRAWIGNPFGDWYAISSLVICSGFLYFAKMAHYPVLWDKFADFSFWIIRLGGLGILIFTEGVQNV